MLNIFNIFCLWFWYLSFLDYWQCENKYDDFQSKSSTDMNSARTKPRRLLPTITTTATDNRRLFRRQRSTPALPATLLQRPPLKKTSKSATSLLKSKNSHHHKCQHEASFNSKVHIYEYAVPLKLLEADSAWESFFHWSNTTFCGFYLMPVVLLHQHMHPASIVISLNSLISSQFMKCVILFLTDNKLISLCNHWHLFF